MDFKEYSKKSGDASSVWAHFLRSSNGSEAKCKICQRIFKIKGSTSTLHNHLNNCHAIIRPSTATTSSNNGDEMSIIKRPKMTDYYKSEDSLEYVIARMVSLDGIAFKLFCTSEDLKKLLRKGGYTKLPSSPNTIKNIVMGVYEDEQKRLKQEIHQLKLKNQKFGLTFDEWTSVNNHRYININIHNRSFKRGFFRNMGLIRIYGSMPAELCISLIRTRLALYDLTLDDCDVLGMTTDGASVMCKVGRLLPIFHQICLAHGIHLGICDVLYSKNRCHLPSQSVNDLLPSLNSDIGVSSEDEEESVIEGEFLIERAGSASPLNLDFRSILKKVRTTVKLFRNSPTKNDSVLQKYVKMNLGLVLLLDCKTRWSSMATMLKRFIKLKTCIQKSLLDLKSDINFTDEEFNLIQDLQMSLDIVKATVEALCRRDATLITADTTLKLMIESLEKKEGNLTKSVSDALKKRVKERRLHCVAGTIFYLHNPREFSNSPSDEVFYKPSKAEIEEVICRTVESRINPIEVSVESHETISREQESLDQEMSFRERLAFELNKINKAGEENVLISRKPETDIPSLVRVEMALFEDSGSRGRYLEAAYKHLQCIPPTSVESERAFSAAGIICNRIRSRCKLLVVGGGAGGCSIAWRFARRMKKHCIILLEPSTIHFYQPAFTFVAAGVRTLDQIYKPIAKLLPRSVTWLHDKAEDFDPCQNLVHTWKGDKIYYEFMVVAVGIKNDYDKIIGLQRALDDPRSTVSTIYSPFYCTKTWQTIQNFSGGHALFTFPVISGKCSGAAMKIMFLAHDHWRKNNIIKKTNITYNTGAETIFGVPKYAVALRTLALNRGIVPNFLANLVEVTPSGAVFQGYGGETISLPYNMLHVTPPMTPPCCLLKCQGLTNEAGYLDIDVHSLQHKRFPNVFGLGDCTCTPNSKTAAALGPQSYVLERNLSNIMAGKRPSAKYNGYGACPLITSYKRGILAEFLYDKKVWETFPFDQSKERRLFYQMNKHLLPYLYWRWLLKGKWNGPGTIRHVINPFRM